mmetsp:Transcript_13804/g.33986  ORF Transcript_13804/g.33986 Transcript_13804/m.33986 type:complete len:793 (-) Transcript_13804:428-2806(-)
MLAAAATTSFSALAADFSDGSVKSRKKFLFNAGSTGEEVLATVSVKGKKENRLRHETQIEVNLNAGKTKNKLSVELVETDWTKVKAEKKKKKKMKAMKKAAPAMKKMKRRGFGGGFFGMGGKRGGFGGVGLYGLGGYLDDFSDDGWSSSDDFAPRRGAAAAAASAGAELVLLNRNNRRIVHYSYASVSAVKIAASGSSSRGGGSSSSSSSAAANPNQQTATWVAVTVSKPGECWQTPKQNEVKQELVKMKRSFLPPGINDASFRLAFPSRAAADSFIASFESVKAAAKDTAAEKREEQKAKKAAGLVPEKRRKGKVEPKSSAELLADELAGIGDDSYAKKSVKKWQLIGGFDAGASEACWKRYYEQRLKDEGSRFDENFENKLRLGLGRALVSTGKVRPEEAALVASGLFLRQYEGGENEDEDSSDYGGGLFDDPAATPRTYAVSVRIYSAAASPAAVDIGFEHYHRERMFGFPRFEKYNFCSALLYKSDSGSYGPDLHAGLGGGLFGFCGSAVPSYSMIAESCWSASGVDQPREKGMKIKLCDWRMGKGDKKSLGTAKNATTIVEALLGDSYDALSSRKAFSALFRAVGVNVPPHTKMSNALWAWKLSKNNLKPGETLTDDEGNSIKNVDVDKLRRSAANAKAAVGGGNQAAAEQLNSEMEDDVDDDVDEDEAESVEDEELGVESDEGENEDAMEEVLGGVGGGKGSANAAAVGKAENGAEAEKDADSESLLYLPDEDGDEDADGPAVVDVPRPSRTSGGGRRLSQESRALSQNHGRPLKKLRLKNDECED